MNNNKNLPIKPTIITLRTDNGHTIQTPSNDHNTDLIKSFMQAVYPHITLPSTDICIELFKQWLVGFTDAEGNFYIQLSKGGRNLVCIFRITRHRDDAAVLYKIRDILGVGSIISLGIKDRRYVMYQVNKYEDLVNVIIPIFIMYPLLSTKYLDFIDFCKVVNLITQKGLRAPWTEEAINLAKSIKAGINRGRTSVDYSAIPATPITQAWFTGFIEGDGSRANNNQQPNFQITQLNKAFHMIGRISDYLSCLPVGYPFSTNTEPMESSSSSVPEKDASVIGFEGIDTRHDILMHFLMQFPFQARKAEDFWHWCLVLYIHKQGFIYTREGRIMAGSILQYINANRYTSNPDRVAPPTLDISLFDTVLPVTLTPDMTHTALAAAYGNLTLGKRLVFVYDKGVLVNGKPFTSAKSAHKALELKCSSSLVARLLDTGKVHMDRYVFTTVPMDDPTPISLTKPNGENPPQ